MVDESVRPSQESSIALFLCHKPLQNKDSSYNCIYCEFGITPVRDQN